MEEYMKSDKIIKDNNFSPITNKIYFYTNNCIVLKFNENNRLNAPAFICEELISEDRIFSLADTAVKNLLQSKKLFSRVGKIEKAEFNCSIKNVITEKGTNSFKVLLNESQLNRIVNLNENLIKTKVVYDENGTYNQLLKNNFEDSTRIEISELVRVERLLK